MAPVSPVASACDDEQQRRRKRQRNRSPDMGPGIMVAFVFASTGILIAYMMYDYQHTPAGLTNWIDSFWMILGYQTHVYIVVFDAGSTGTRLLLFTFHRDYERRLLLDSEVFQEIQPGLSSYARSPEKLANGLNDLLKHAEKHVFPPALKSTPVLLKATAGLRMLPINQSIALLSQVKKVFNESRFNSSGDSVAILDGTYEGLYSWVTINFLLEWLDKDLNNSVAVLDLGGGSTQLTFFPVEEETLKEAPENYKVNFTIGYNKTVEMYTHSFTGLGLMSARLSILNDSGLNDQDDAFETVCVHEDSPPQAWRHHGKFYIVSGLSAEEVLKKMPVRGENKTTGEGVGEEVSEGAGAESDEEPEIAEGEGEAEAYVETKPSEPEEPESDVDEEEPAAEVEKPAEETDGESASESDKEPPSEGEEEDVLEESVRQQSDRQRVMAAQDNDEEVDDDMWDDNVGKPKGLASDDQDGDADESEGEQPADDAEEGADEGATDVGGEAIEDEGDKEQHADEELEGEDEELKGNETQDDGKGSGEDGRQQEDVEQKVVIKSKPPVPRPFLEADMASKFGLCLQLARKVLLPHQINKSAELNARKTNAISYFYDAAVQAGLIHHRKGGKVMAEQYCLKAMHVCNKRNDEFPFLCMDLTYICALFEAYGFSRAKPISLQKKINGHETSWALGAAFNYLYQH